MSTTSCWLQHSAGWEAMSILLQIYLDSELAVASGDHAVHTGVRKLAVFTSKLVP